MAPPIPPTQGVQSYRQDPNQQRYTQVPTYQGTQSQTGQVPLYNMAGPSPPGDSTTQASQQHTQIFHPTVDASSDHIRYDSPPNDSNSPSTQQYQQESGYNQAVTLQESLQQQQQYYPYSGELQPMVAHWFYKREDGAWVPFTRIDSGRIEDSYINKNSDIITTDGGRFDVDIKQRIRYPIYWNGANAEVRRGTWFYRSEVNSYLIPYEENVAEKLEVTISPLQYYQLQLRSIKYW